MRAVCAMALFDMSKIDPLISSLAKLLKTTRTICVFRHSSLLRLTQGDKGR